MSKEAILFACNGCDAQYQKWIGRCLECGKWGTITEIENAKSNKQISKNKTPGTKTQTLQDISGKDIARKMTHMPEFDRVLGGGIVPGSLILLGGEPGIGKSTLTIQLASALANTLYISGEESVEQVKLRADRLGITSTTLKLANETNAEIICATIEQEKPSIAIIDSIQTISSKEVAGEPGNVTQIRACTALLLDCAKRNNIAVCIIGHVTKDGTVAGPRTLEHLVDTVLYLEGERYHSYRVLRAVKNRFGATDEVGMFEMTEEGLKDVVNASALLLQERGENAPGSIITCLMEGTRPILIEIQALVNKTAFGYPVRKASGFDLNRVHVLAAVLEKRAGLQLSQYDIHINVVGGIKANEPAVDLAVCLAITGSYKDKALGKDLAVFGEVGLGGEVRSVSHAERRIKECEAMGMNKIITAKNTRNTGAINRAASQKNIKVISVNNIQDLITHA